MRARVARPRLKDLSAAPNLLSLLRLALVPVALCLMAAEERGWAVAVLLAMALTDGLDGYVARLTSRVTELGKLLDPLADKVAVDSVLLLLTLRGEFPFWALIVILVRDAGIAVVALLVSRRAGGIPAANVPGKVAFVLLAALAVVFTADLDVLETPTMLAAMVMVGVSSASYAARAARALRAAPRGSD